MKTVMVLIIDEETGESKFYQHQYEHNPTLIGVEHRPESIIQQAMAEKYNYWADALGGDFNMLDSDVALGTTEDQDRFWREILRSRGIETASDVERLLGEG